MMDPTAYSWGQVATAGSLMLVFFIFLACRDIKRAPTRKATLKLVKIYLVVVVIGVGLFAGLTHFEVGDKLWPQPEVTTTVPFPTWETWEPGKAEK